MSDPVSANPPCPITGRPGVRLMAVPKFPSGIYDIPNLVFKALPHHLTWWNERAPRSAKPVELLMIARRPQS